MKGIQDHSPAAAIIARLGGEETVSSITGTVHTAPCRWQAPRYKDGICGMIPQRHDRRLMDDARAKGIPLTAEEFKSAESATE